MVEYDGQTQNISMAGWSSDLAALPHTCWHGAELGNTTSSASIASGRGRVPCARKHFQPTSLVLGAALPLPREEPRPHSRGRTAVSAALPGAVAGRRSASLPRAEQRRAGPGPRAVRAGPSPPLRPRRSCPRRAEPGSVRAAAAALRRASSPAQPSPAQPSPAQPSPARRTPACSPQRPARLGRPEPAMGCFECCIKCLGGVPYASLVATILCFSGVALFCGCGHVALTGTVSILEQHFSTTASDHALLSEVIQLMQYVIYGIASFFFLYGIILLAEGFYTTSAVKELHGEFKTTACGRCISGMFVFLTYVLGVAWLGVFGFSAVPVFMFYNIWSTCEVIKSLQINMTVPGDQICVDIRQYGIIPWNAVPGKACGPILENICNTNEFYMSYHLFIVACAGAGATVIALLIYMMATTYNYAVLKFKSREDCCTKF
uniref:Glycoprotein M6B n=2 Tax=Phasianinae TaxID=9072 RepID=A0A669PKW7_PHACC